MDLPAGTGRDRCWTLALPRPLGANRSLRAETMDAAELMFFYGAPLAHVVEYGDHLKAMRREQAARRLARARKPFDPIPRLGPRRELCDAGADQ